MIKKTVLTLVTVLLSCSPLSTQESNEPEENFEYLWETYDRNYGIFTAKKVDWKALYEIYRPQVTPETTNEELFEIMSRLLGHLNDNHVRLQYGERRFQSGILGEMEMEDFSLDLIKDKYLKGKHETRVRDVFTYGWVSDDIAYFHFRGFGFLDQSQAAIDEIVSQFKDAKGIIVDVRNNGGGDDRVGKLIADRFADRKRHYMTTYTRNGPKHDDFSAPKYWYVEPDGPRQFTKTVILLTHRFSVSAAENFALAMRVIPNVTVVGDATSGVFADVYRDELPNGWQFSVSFKLFVDHTGFCWEGIGVPADLRVTNTKEDIEQQNDKVLELAVDLINSGALAPQAESASIASLKESLVERLAKDLETKGVEVAIQAFEKAKAESPEHYTVDEDDLRLLGEELFKQGDKLDEAVEIFRLNEREFPESYSAHAHLGEAYIERGEVEHGRTHLKKAQELNRQSYPWEREAYELNQKMLDGKKLLSRTLERAAGGGRLDQELEAYRKQPDTYYVDESAMNRLGYQLLGREKIDEAIEVFKVNTLVFPESWNVWDSLGEGYMTRGDDDLAIKNYEKSLELNPQNDNGRGLLKKLKEGK
jgi:tetratricopeptide (TPR) repeat protein